MDSDEKTYIQNPNTRPLKLLSYYLFIDPELFDEMGIDSAVEAAKETYHIPTLSKEFLLSEMEVRPVFIIVSWAYANPDKTISIGHTLTTLSDQQFSFDILDKGHPGEDFRLLPTYEITKITYHNDAFDDFYQPHTFLDMLFKIYPDLKPNNESIKNWLETGQMSEDLERKLFIPQTLVAGW